MPMMNEPISKKFSEKNSSDSYGKDVKYSYSDSWSKSAKDQGNEKSAGKGKSDNPFGPMFRDRAHFNSMHFN
jgi:hypothetical protein